MNNTQTPVIHNHSMHCFILPANPTLHMKIVHQLAHIYMPSFAFSNQVLPTTSSSLRTKRLTVSSIVLQHHRRKSINSQFLVPSRKCVSWVFTDSNALRAATQRQSRTNTGARKPSRTSNSESARNLIRRHIIRRWCDCATGVEWKKPKPRVSSRRTKLRANFGQFND